MLFKLTWDSVIMLSAVHVRATGLSISSSAQMIHASFARFRYPLPARTIIMDLENANWLLQWHLNPALACGGCDGGGCGEEAPMYIGTNGIWKRIDHVWSTLLVVLACVCVRCFILFCRYDIHSIDQQRRKGLRFALLRDLLVLQFILSSAGRFPALPLVIMSLLPPN